MMASCPWIEATGAVVRRVVTNNEFNSRDFEIALARRMYPGGQELYQLPYAAMHVGESSREAVLRAVQATLDVSPKQCHRVTTRSHPRRSLQRQSIAVLYIALCDHSAVAQDTMGHKCSFHNLGDVVESEQIYSFKDDHRELLYAAMAWIRQSFKKKRTQHVFNLEDRRKVQTVVVNQMVARGLGSSLDLPPFTFDNPYFTSGVLNPDDAASVGVMRNADATVAGLPDVDVTVETQTPQPVTSPASFLGRAPQQFFPPTNSTVDGPHGSVPVVQGNARGDSPGSVDSDDSPIYSEVVKPITARQSTRSAQFLNNSHSPQSPPLADTPRGRVTAGVPDRPTFWDDADDVIHLNTDGSPDTEFGFSDDDDDDVGLALTGIRNSTRHHVSSPDAKKRNSSARLSGIADEEHPFNDDLQADFSNPLAVR